MWDIEAQIKYYEDQISRGEGADVGRLQMLKEMMQEKIIENRETVKKILEKQKS